MHTPGPWKANNSLTRIADGHDVLYVSARSEVVAQCWTTGFDRDLQPNDMLIEQSANAQLIAAAPELLFTAQAVVETFETLLAGDPILKHIEHLKAAIAKATNEPQTV